MIHAPCHDDSIGPVVRGCRDGFDFTQLFENTIFSMAPSGMLIIFSIARMLYLRRKPKLIFANVLLSSKLETVLVIFTSLQISLLVLWTVEPILRSWSAITAASMSLCAAFILYLLSLLEHARSIQPSTTIIGFLLFSILFDVVRCRTLWLTASDSSLPYVFTTSVVVKVFILVLESVEKARYLPLEIWENRPEVTSSILNRSVFYWLNRLMLRGSRHLLTPEDLYELDHDLSADQLAFSYITSWESLSNTNERSALLATLKSLKSPLLITVFPRVILLVLTLSQPLLIQSLLKYLATPIETTSKKSGYGLIGAYALVYIGSAISAGAYWRLHHQFLVMVRGCLVSAVSWRITKLNIQTVHDPKAAVTLMSTDVGRIMEGLFHIHEFWASTAQFSVAVYLLKKQIGIACTIPIAISLLCAAVTACVSKESNKRQVAWMEAVQARISVTSVMLSSIESVKMRGLVNGFVKTIQSFRLQEIMRANSWRMLILGNIGVSYIPEWVSPVVTFALYINQTRASGQSFDATRGFTSLSLMIVMTQPMNVLVRSVPELVGAWGCFCRIGEFLSAEERQDFRLLFNNDGDNSSLHFLSDNEKDYSEPIDQKNCTVSHFTKTRARGQPLIRITDGTFGWVKGCSILNNLNVVIPKGYLTCIVGPVACGKSTLCKTLLGETCASRGRLEIFESSKEIAFCDQTPHLCYGTIKDNIIAFSGLDINWYETVVRACALEEDITAMPKQDDTLVGSDGVSLSGGQRQKVALARALYARKSILILDDALSSLDAVSEQTIFQNVIGSHGLAQKRGTTVIFATNAVKFLPFSDHMIALDSDGRVVQQGSYESVQMKQSYISALENGKRSGGQAIEKREDVAQVETFKAREQILKADLSHHLRGYAIYHYYFHAAGLLSTILMLTYGIGCSASFNLSTFWLKLWIDASSKSHHYNDRVYLGVYGLLQCLSVIFLVLLAYQILIRIINKTGINLHRNLLETVANASLMVFNTTDKGSIINRFSQDIQLIDMQLPIGLQGLVACTLVAIGQIILIVASSPWTGITIPIVFVVFYLVQKFYLRTSRQLRLLDLEAKGPLYSHFLETLSGLATIRAFGWTDSNFARARRLVDFSQKPIYLLYMAERWLTFVIDMVIACIAVMVVSLAVSQRASGGFTGIALTQVMLVNLTLRGVILAWTEVETSIGAVSRIKGFCESTPLEQGPQDNGLLAVDWPRDGKIELTDVSAAYGAASDSPALSKINLTIQAGEKLGVCGRSGSGKSSLVRALLQMLNIHSGLIKIDDIDLQQVPCNTIRERLNVLPQNSVILPGTVRSNLDPYNEHPNSAIIDALKKTQVWSAIEATGGIDSSINGELLSHGQRQLFCLATAILKKSQIVILDEVTSSVDDGTDGIIQKIIRDEFSRRTVVVIAHRLNTIMDFDRVAVLDHGVLCELGTPDVLMNKDSIFRSMSKEQGLV